MKLNVLLFCIYLEGNNKLHTFALTISRDGAVVARQAHNLEVVGSNPASATEKKQSHRWLLF